MRNSPCPLSDTDIACRFRKSTSAAVLATAVAALTLSACGDRVLETGLNADYVFGTADPLPDEGRVRRIGDGEALSYPNLATVPARPAPPPSPVEKQIQTDRLAADSFQARSLKEELENYGGPATP